MIKLMHKLHQDKSGAASLLTVIFISMILSILVIGFVRVAIKESQTSTDADLSNRAFYAAEAGLEDGVRALKQYLSGTDPIDLNENTCAEPEDDNEPDKFDSDLSTPEEFDTEYTCLLIDKTPDYYEAALGKNETKQISIDTDGVLAHKLILEWHINDDEGGDGANPPLRLVKDLPPTNAWDDGTDPYPAMLRFYIFSYNDGNFNGSELRNSDSVAYLNPADSSVADLPINYQSGNRGTNDSWGVHSASCASNAISGGYVCRQEVSINTNGRNNVIRISSIYAATHIRIHLEDNSDNLVSFDGLQAVIDSTGRANDVYRRIEKRVDLSAVFADLLPDYALYSAEDVCKNMIVYSAGAHTPTNCAVDQ